MFKGFKGLSMIWKDLEGFETNRNPSRRSTTVHHHKRSAWLCPPLGPGWLIACTVTVCGSSWSIYMYWQFFVSNQV